MALKVKEEEEIYLAQTQLITSIQQLITEPGCQKSNAGHLNTYNFYFFNSQNY